ncbi:hypothetical protein [Paraburkholderia sp. C35]|uniref:hypothetical protein n=1 Tax=Paraburkholderia sp. C35 TaxID=2126993 RepID=UPI000D692582|nr:hypothetical protein [Paraburkholderia sp. C35]
MTKICNDCRSEHPLHDVDCPVAVAAVAARENKLRTALLTLEGLGYTYTDGAERWRPPIGPRPEWLDEPGPPLSEAEETRIANLAIEAVTKSGVATMTREQKTAYLTMIGQAAHQLLRSVEGDAYVRGWLDASIVDLKRAPFLTFRKLDA